MDKKVQINSSSLGLGTILFIVFLVLKLVGVISWSWWLVCLPLLIPIALVVLTLVIVGICALVAIILDR